MKIKNGLNLMLFVIITVLFVNFSCSSETESNNNGILLKTDSDFSAMSVKDGMFRSFLFYIAEDGVILRDKSYPSVGKEALVEYYKGKSDTSFVLSWVPVFEQIAESGELGYTYGIWTNTIKESGQISKGTYATVWKKQKDGSWRFVLDLGTQDLPEEPE